MIRLIGLVGFGAFALAASALAQVTPPAVQTADNDSLTQIVVTGSRLLKNGDSLPTPVTVVSVEDLLLTTPSNLAEGLNKLPSFSLSRGTAILNNNTDNFTGNYLNLRGFGIQRNLVLFDGHRAVPSSYTGAVDANGLPQMLMQRVDIVTGGASAVYGSDAVSGVINFVLDKKFNGIEADAQAGISGHDDAFSWKAGIAAGTDLFGGRGHFEGSYEHFKQQGIPSRSDRELGRQVYAIAGSGSTADPFRLITNARNGAFGFLGTVLSGSAAGEQFNSPGVLGPMGHGTPEGGSLESGGDGFYGAQGSATADLLTDQVFARFDFDITDSLQWYVQGSYGRSQTFNNFYSNLLFPALIGPDNPYLSPAAAAAAPFVFARVLDDQQGAIGIRDNSKNYMAATGLQGSLGRFKWDIFYEHGSNSTYNYTTNNELAGNLAAALDAVDQGSFQNGVANGSIVCRVTLTNPGAYPGCKPLNPFGTSPQSQRAALNYIYADNYNKPTFTLDDVEASIAGVAFNNWAGPVNAAASAAFRRQALDVATDDLTTDFANCTGIAFNCTQGVTNVFRAGAITPISVSEHVSEAALESDFPLLKDNAFVGSLDLNGAVRFTDYSTSGSVTTWKLGVDWQLTDSLRFRATRSRDIRAPSLYDRYQPLTGANSGYQDLHTGFGGIVPTETGGNPNLVPEVAQVWTVGTVFHPVSAPDFSLAVDYYKMSVDNAISQIDGRLAAIQQVCEASGGTSTFCSLYVRPFPFSNTSPANAPTSVSIITLNASTLTTWGIDVEANYSARLGPGRLVLRSLVGYQPELTTVLAPGIAPLVAAGTAATQGVGGVPKVRLTQIASYETALLGVALQERWRSSLRWDSNAANIFAIPNVPSVAYTDLTLTWNIGQDKRRQAFLSVQNLFDKQPPVYLTAGTSGTPAFSFPAVSGDDIIGRYFTAGVRYKF